MSGQKLKITIGEPQIVAQGPVGEKRWGFWQFPSFGYNTKNEISVSFNVCEDSATAYGSPSPCFVLKSGQWVPSKESNSTGFLLPNGDKLSHDVPSSIKVSELKLPAPVGQWISSYGSKYVFYRSADLPPELANIRFLRCRKGSDTWTKEIADVDEPDGVRGSPDGVFPLTGGGWFSMKMASDDSLILFKYGLHMLYLFGDVNRIRGPEPFTRIIILRSTDNGRKWQVQGSIPYRPDLDADPAALQRYGFTEPGFEFAEDGTLVCFIRTTDGCGLGPMYISRSQDMGKIWSKPEVFHPFGVLPQVLRLKNGVMALSYGRPGVEMRFSGDNGRTWTQPYSIVPVSTPDHVKDYYMLDSCGYTSLLAVGEDKCLIAYSDFKYKDSAGNERKTILTREIVVNRK